MAKIPSIIDFLSENQKNSVRFIKPNTTDGSLIGIHPETKIIQVRKIRLDDGRAIPFHVHKQKEKLYILLTDTNVTFFLYENNVCKKVTLNDIGESLSVQPMVPHAIFFGENENRFENTAALKVIISSQDNQDIEWEPNLEILLENRHLKY
jgi:hypothetical protein